MASRSRGRGHDFQYVGVFHIHVVLKNDHTPIQVVDKVFQVNVLFIGSGVDKKTDTKHQISAEGFFCCRFNLKMEEARLTTFQIEMTKKTLADIWCLVFDFLFNEKNEGTLTFYYTRVHISLS